MAKIDIELSKYLKRLQNIVISKWSYLIQHFLDEKYEYEKNKKYDPNSSDKVNFTVVNKQDTDITKKLNFCLYFNSLIGLSDYPNNLAYKYIKLKIDYLYIKFIKLSVKYEISILVVISKFIGLCFEMTNFTKVTNKLKQETEQPNKFLLLDINSKNKQLELLRMECNFL